MMDVSPIATLGMAVCQISVGSQIAWGIASAFLAYLSDALGPEQMRIWGWRVPFVISIFPGLLAMWGRSRMHPESDAEEEKAVDAEIGRSDSSLVSGTDVMGLIDLYKQYWPNLLIGFGSTVGIATMWFVAPFWTLTVLELGAADTLWVGNSAQLVGLAVTPLAGWLADRMGVAWTMLAGAAFFTAVGLPIYSWLTLYPAEQIVAYSGIGVFYGLAQGFSGAIVFLFVAELFPAKVRGQGIGASYNIAISFVGGFGSMICEALFQVSPSFAPGIWFSATGFVSALTVVSALVLQRHGLVKLTHTRSAPYFGRSACAVASDSESQKCPSENDKK